MQKDRAAELRAYLSTRAEALLDAAHELEIMGYQFSDWAEELAEAGTSGATLTCGPEDWRDELVHWCRVHMGPATHCPTAAGQPPATAGTGPTWGQSQPASPAIAPMPSPPMDRTGD